MGKSITFHDEVYNTIYKQEYRTSTFIRFVEIVCIFWSIVFVILLFPCSLYFVIYIIREYEKCVLVRMGKLWKNSCRGAGVLCIIPIVDTVYCVDTRLVSYYIPAQEVLTKDSCTISVEAVVFFCVKDPVKALFQVLDYSYATNLLAATALRNLMGTKDLAEILVGREELAQTIRDNLDKYTLAWGILVERVEIKDVRLPISLQRAMAAEAEAQREARSKVVAADGELKAATDLKKASEIISLNSTALQLRYLQTLNSIAAEKNATVLFPIPVDLLSVFSQ